MSQPKYKLIVLGDFNATISRESKNTGVWDAVLGHNFDRVETNGNGERFLSWCFKTKCKLLIHGFDQSAFTDKPGSTQQQANEKELTTYAPLDG